MMLECQCLGVGLHTKPRMDVQNRGTTDWKQIKPWGPKRHFGSKGCIVGLERYAECIGVLVYIDA